MSLLGFSWINHLLLNEVVGIGSVPVSQLYEASANVEFGSGYLSEYFGPYGDILF